MKLAGFVERASAGTFFVIVAMAVLGLFQGCAIAPDYLKPEVAHTSHITQHEPFTRTPTNFGYSQVGAYVGWHLPAHGYLEIGDSYAIEPLDGMHEVFNARAGFEVPLK